MRTLGYAGRVLLAAVLYATIAVGGASAQANTAQDVKANVAAKQPAYDVVSIKPNKSGNEGSSVDPSADGFSATNFTLKGLLLNAYDVKSYLIFGLSGWADSDHFDVNAKVADMDAETLKKLTGEQRQTMLRQLLVDRFHLKAHMQTEVLPIYEMLVAKGGPKFKEVEPVGPDPEADRNKTFKSFERGSMAVSYGKLMGHDLRLSQLAYALSYESHRTVVDKTGLTGKYDIALTWSPEDAPASDSSAPSIFTSLQEQLGLKLQSAKGPVETLVVDHVEMPSEN
jgi:uncharacterized protein (TIGR03435 family)